MYKAGGEPPAITATFGQIVTLPDVKLFYDETIASFSGWKQITGDYMGRIDWEHTTNATVSTCSKLFKNKEKVRSILSYSARF